MTQVDLWTLENELRTPDTEPLCGVDEAGRGPLAGPVCAAAVMLPPGLEIPGLNDSKKLSEKKREALYDIIIAQALSYGIAFATVEEIEERNILGATFLAMNRAVPTAGARAHRRQPEHRHHRAEPMHRRRRRQVCRHRGGLRARKGHT